MMTQETIRTAQMYLTIDSKKILDVETLSKRHTDGKIIALLEDLLKDKKKEVKDLISLSIAGTGLDKAIVECFRVSLALNLIREEVNYEKSKAEQGTESSSRSAK